MALGWSLGMTGFLPKRNLVNESPLPLCCAAEGFPRQTKSSRQRRAGCSERLGQAWAGSSLGAGGCTTPAASLVRFFRGCPFHTSPLVSTRMDKNGWMLCGETKVTGSKVTT